MVIEIYNQRVYSFLSGEVGGGLLTLKKNMKMAKPVHNTIHSFIHSFSESALNTYSAAGNVLDSGHTKSVRYSVCPQGTLGLRYTRV